MLPITDLAVSPPELLQVVQLLRRRYPPRLRFRRRRYRPARSLRTRRSRPKITPRRLRGRRPRRPPTLAVGWTWAISAAPTGWHTTRSISVQRRRPSSLPGSLLAQSAAQPAWSKFTWIVFLRQWWAHSSSLTRAACR